MHDRSFYVCSMHSQRCVPCSDGAKLNLVQMRVDGEVLEGWGPAPSDASAATAIVVQSLRSHDRRRFESPFLSVGARCAGRLW